jgi:D-cysteine desulfhydrase family pyridoxal phosphate-dependent enzyme
MGNRNPETIAMGDIRLARVPLATLPTPVEELPRLSQHLGCRIFIKRDDLTGLAMGGNKTRKLEFLVADAISAGARTLITAGAPQSNHCRQTAAAAARMGLRCVLILSGEKSQAQASTGNILLDTLLGAEIVWTEGQGRDEMMDRVLERERRAGHQPYLIPYGGSNPIGAAAYAVAMQEFAAQQIEVEWVVFATSSGGTQAGLALGARLTGLKVRLHGISVDKAASPFREQVAELANRTAEKVGADTRIRPEELIVDDRFVGAGYGKPDALELGAITLFARMEGMLLDPVYTGRAAGGMLSMIRSREIPPGARVLFWHTGGTPALWAYSRQLATVTG